MFKRICFVPLLFAVLGCGSLGPSPANVAGLWTGSIQFTHMSNGMLVQATQTVTFNLTQNGKTVSGTWQTTDGTVAKSGNATGNTTQNAFSGTFTFSATTIATGATCAGTLVVSGPAGGSSLTWTSPGVMGDCSDPPTSITFTMVKQS